MKMRREVAALHPLTPLAAMLTALALLLAGKARVRLDDGWGGRSGCVIMDGVAGQAV